MIEADRTLLQAIAAFLLRQHPDPIIGGFPDIRREDLKNALTVSLIADTAEVDK